VSDVIEIARNIAAAAGGGRIQRHRPLERKPALSIGDVRSRYYLRFSVEDRPGVLGRLTTVLGEHQVSIRQVVQDGAGEAGPVSVVVLTHDAREGDVRAAIDAIAKTVVAPTKVIRVMGAP
jgi:homoserine dehydrogenase